MVDAILWWLALTLFGPLAVLTLAPLIVRSGQWFVRTWDFPRLQLAGLTILPAAPLVVLLVRGSHPTSAAVLLVLLGAMALSAFVLLLPFTRLWRIELANATGAADSSAGPGLTILVANICYESERYEDVQRAIADANPDLVLLIEIDETWKSELAGLRDSFPHRVESIADEGLGLALWSRRELRDARVEHIMTERRPSIFADVSVPDGRWIRFVGLHPTPPGLRDSTGEDRRDSRVRDGELVLLARRIADDPHQNWVVAGDFNDVAWSHTTRLFRRLSGLLDPRIGRALLNTYHAGYALLRFPVDHLFLAPGFLVGRLERVRLPGSDHFGVLCRFELEPMSEADPASPEADGEDQEEADEAVEEGVEDARERGVEAH